MRLRRMGATATSVALIGAVIATAPSASAAACSPSSGTAGSDVVLTFTATSACTWEVPAGVTSLRLLLVGGGGGGGADNGSGGGGGGIASEASVSVTGGDELTITAGAGGAGGLYRAGGTANVAATAGSPSIVVASTTHSAAGGTGGATSGFSEPGGVAGPGGTGTGGASAAGTGSPTTEVGQVGSDGSNSDITGSTVAYAGGGGGGIYPDALTDGASRGPVAGGAGGGGAGAGATAAGAPVVVTYAAASSGTNGLGGGGGGGSANDMRDGGNGGSGVVIIRYAIDPTIVTNVAVNAGNNQSATVGSSVATRPSVVVRNGLGNVVSGATVVFAVATGGGSLSSSGTVTSDGSGIATAPAWTLGNSPGANSLTATVTGAAESPLTFTATAVGTNNSSSDSSTPNSSTPAPTPPTTVASAANPWAESPQDATPYPPVPMLSALQRDPRAAVVMTPDGSQAQSLAPAPSGGVRVIVGNGVVLVPGLGYVDGSAIVSESGNLSTAVSDAQPSRLATSYLLAASSAITPRAARSNIADSPVLLAASFANAQGIAELQASVPPGTRSGAYVLQINLVSQSLGPISLGIPIQLVPGNSMTISEHTFFKARSATLTKAGKARLAQLRQEIPAGTPTSTISIVGVSLGESSTSANRALAKKRAKILHERLTAMNIDGEVDTFTLVTRRSEDERVARSSKGRPLSTISITY